MISRLLKIALAIIVPLACDCLKMSPPHRLRSSWVHKRQASGGLSAPSVTTLVAPNPYLVGGASSCICRLVQPFDQYTTITSTYIASGSLDRVSTSTLALATGITRGTIEIFTPITLGTSVVTSGTTAPLTQTTFTTLPDGSTTSYVLIVQPVLSTVTQISGMVSATTTVLTTDIAGASTTVVVVNIPLSTITTTSGSVGYTSTVLQSGTSSLTTPFVVVDEPVRLCGSQGWQWAYATIPAYDHGFTNDFDFSSLQCSVDYIHQDTTNAIYIPEGAANAPSVRPPVVPGYTYNFYGKYTASIAPAAINHRAFFIPPSSGSYTFQILNADDAAAIWLGTDALINWNNRNELAEYYYVGNRSTTAGASARKTVQLETGACTPIRVAWIDGSSPGGLSISILGPDGTSLDGSNYIRDTCCDSPITFNNFGAECATRPTLSTTTLYQTGTPYTTTAATSASNGNPTKVVVINSPASTKTIVGGTSGYTTVSTVSAPGGTASAVVVVDLPLCGTQGWQWAYARIPLADHGFKNDFDFSTLQRATYSFTGGSITSIGFNPMTPSSGNQGPYYGPTVSFYGQYSDTEGAAALNHRAFFVPPTTGTYTFAITQADDEVAIYLGSSALRGFSNNNQLVETYFTGGSKSVQATLQQYSCNPIRVVWIDGSSPGFFNITITGPDGTLLQNGPYIRSTCCGNPYTFSQFGNEA